ncbi:hypothetical protein [Pseudomonas serbica]|uniref:hypothetical protein n=1 Tax=Pseudomonas serbica TaxID=2965074 RepID=UPI00237B4EBE|nr:hypothetical protein [Pseudomonas serbica]
MSDDQINEVVLSEALNAKLVDFIESRIMDPDPILEAQFESAPEVVNFMGELAGALDQGDDACYALVNLAADAEHLGFACRSTTHADFNLLRGVSEVLVQSHPKTGLLLLALSPPHKYSDRNEGRLKGAAKDLVELVEQVDLPGLTELNALLSFSEGLDLALPAAKTSREQIPLLCMAEAILTRLEEEGQTLPIERAQLRYVGQNYFNFGIKALPDYLSFYNRASQTDYGQEPEDYQCLARERLNPLFKFILDSSRARNQIGDTLDDVLSRLLKLLNPTEGNPDPKPTPWITEGTNALLSRQPENVLKLALNTFQVPVNTFINSVKRSPNNTNLNWYFDNKKLAETGRIEKLNAYLGTTAHDPAERRTAFTNLLIVTLKLAQEDLVKIHDQEIAKGGLDDLFQLLAPHADLASISPALNEAENDLWAGYILRHHRHLHNLVPLKSIGNNFSHDLGV